MLAATVLIGGLGLWLLIMVVAVAMLQVKLRAEERLLEAAFPVEYAEFRRRVPQLVPLVRLPRR
jgi:protein-S-isoprenylcysteine O-methyltransferase Ste14